MDVAPSPAKTLSLLKDKTDARKAINSVPQRRKNSFHVRRKLID